MVCLGAELIVEGFTLYAGSALAATVFLRSVIATFLPLVGPTMNEKLGLGWYDHPVSALITGATPFYQELRSFPRLLSSTFMRKHFVLYCSSNSRYGDRIRMRYAEQLPVVV